VWRALLDVDLIGPLATVRYAIDAFDPTVRCDVLLVGPSACLTPMPDLGVDSASKRGLQAAFDSMRLELAHLCVNVLDQARLAEIARGIGPNIANITRPLAIRPELLDRFANRAGYLKPAEGGSRLDEVDRLIDEDLAGLARARG